jgi:hypothetical protein
MLCTGRSISTSTSKTSQERKAMKTVNDNMAELPEARRQKIEARAAELVAEEVSLRELRRAHRLTQARVGKTLKIGQDGVSRLEQRSDLLISTLRSYCGGTLAGRAVAFPFQRRGEPPRDDARPTDPAIRAPPLPRLGVRDEAQGTEVGKVLLRQAARSTPGVAPSTQIP